MFTKLRKNEKGAVGIFTVLIIAFGLLAFSAVVIDVGILYNARRTMVNAADAGALAGAKEMEKTLGVDNWFELYHIRQDARAIARATAIANGAEGTPIVNIYFKSVRLADGNYDYRQVIEVTTNVNQELLFFRFLDQTDADVGAKACATWGYVNSVTGGQMLPLYVREDLYMQVESLHDGRMTFNDVTYANQHGFIFLDPTWNGQAILNEAISGVPTQIILELDTEFEGKPGVANSAISAVETRMKKAQTLPTAAERRGFMYGLVPVVSLSRTQGNQLFFNIEYFAVYEILDVMVNNNKGSNEALIAPDYNRIGIGKTYNPSTEGRDYVKGAILGRFTGEVRELHVIVESNDQYQDPDFINAAGYSLLIQ